VTWLCRRSPNASVLQGFDELVDAGLGRAIGGDAGAQCRVFIGHQAIRNSICRHTCHCLAVPDDQENKVKLSARNQLPGTVSEIRRGEAIANVVLDVAGQRLVASITVEAVDELGLAEGKEVTVIVKASDVILATD
jgi:molybdopterin-binding protein